MKNSLAVQDQLKFSVHYDYEFLSDPHYGSRAIPNVNRERTDNATTTVFAALGVTGHIGVALAVPFRSVTNEKVLLRGQNPNQYEGGKYVRHASGLGDIVVMLNYAVPLAAGLPGMHFGIGLKLANGSVDAKDQYGVRFADNLQIGSGSVDPILALNVLHRFESLTVSASVFTRITSRQNIYGYKYGNELHASLSLEYESEGWLYGGVSLKNLITSRDRYQFGQITRERGGKWMYLSPELGVNVLDNLSVEFHLPVVVFQNVNESQLTSDYLIELSTSYAFSL
ncbi:MAG: transporter [Gemmatimonadota bacterium]|nr:transporter [Gemmatimonadota bacterium]